MELNPMFPRRTVHVLLISAAATLVSASAMGGGLQKSRVAADAQWLAHIDVQAMAASTLGRAVLEPEADANATPHAPADGDAAAKLKVQLEVDSEQVNDMFEAMKGE